MPPKEKPKKENYVSNKDFTTAVVEYATLVKDSAEKGIPEPRIPEYIGCCILKISKGIASRPNFSGYSYKDEMIMDGVENCLRALSKYKIDAKTRSGTPNAFAYFTQICWYAFLRRIQKEKRQEDIKQAVMEMSDSSCFANFGDDPMHNTETIVSNVKNKRENRSTPMKKKLPRKKFTRPDSPLGLFLV
jgi:hypothetical protein